MSNSHSSILNQTDPTIEALINFFNVYSSIYEVYLSYLGDVSPKHNSGTLMSLKVKYHENISSDIGYYY